MADKEINIKITTEAETSNLDDLANKVSEVKSNIEELGSSTNEELTLLQRDFEAATENVERLQEALDEAHLNGDDIEADIIADMLSEAEAEAERLGEAIDNITSTSLDESSGSAEELSDTLENASDSAENLGDSLSNMSSEGIDNASQSSEDLTNELDKSSQASDNLNSSLGLIDANMLLTTAQQLKQYGVEAEGMAQDMNTAAISVGQLATQAGIAEPQMVSLVNYISNATFPQQEAMQYIEVLNQLGVSGDKLGDSATSMDRINDAFGIGSNAVVNLTGNLYAMGVSADNLPSSFNALAYAQSNVAGGVDKFSTVLQRLGPSFSEYGFSVDQAAIITAGATHQWGSGRKAMTNLSNALKDANGDTRALEQALGLEAGALDNASQITGQYSGQVETLAGEEKEHKTILDELGAAWEDISLKMSPVLSPMASFMGLVGQAGSYAVGINGLFKLADNLKKLKDISLLASAATKAQAAAQWLLNIAMDANPIMLVVIAIIALVAILGYLYFNNEQVRAAIDNLGATLLWIGQIIYTTLVSAIQWLITEFQNFTNQLGLNTNNWVDLILGFIAFIPRLPLSVGIALANAIAKVLGFGDNFMQGLSKAAIDGYNAFKNGIHGLRDLLRDELDAMLKKVEDFSIQLPGGLGAAANLAKEAWQYSSGEHSPGYMYNMFSGELDAMESRAILAQYNLPSIMRTTGGNLVSNFNTTNLNSQISNINGSSNGGGDIIVNVYGDIDNDKRIRDLVDAVRRELSWNNTTAGRTI